MLKKEIEELRRENLRRATEFNEMKSQMHEEQRKNINLEGENYHLSSQN